MVGEITLHDAEQLNRFDEIRELFVEYSKELGLDFCFQGFDDELASLPGKYAQPEGSIIAALNEDREIVGLVALRPFEGESEACEMKRMYVRPDHRGIGLGRRLATSILEEGRRIGYTTMVLDTLSKLKPAIALYESLGFRHTEAYYSNPINDVVYMRISM